MILSTAYLFTVAVNRLATDNLDHRDFITRFCWLANTTGRHNSFLPFDELQEHNIRDIKVSIEILDIVQWHGLH